MLAAALSDIIPLSEMRIWPLSRDGITIISGEEIPLPD
jgi:hypothetical protein